MHLQCGSLTLQSHPGARRSSPWAGLSCSIRLARVRGATGRSAAWTGALGRASAQRAGRPCRHRREGRCASLLLSFELFPQGDTLPHPRALGMGWGTPSPCSEGFKNNFNEFLSRQVTPPPAEPPRRCRQVSGAGLGHTSGPASPAGAAVAVLQASPPLGAILGAGGSGASGPWAGRRAGLAPGSGPAPAGPPGEVSGRHPPSASRRLPPERSPRCTLGARARAERPGRADQAGGRGAGAAAGLYVLGGAGEADRYSLRGEGATSPSRSCGGQGNRPKGGRVWRVGRRRTAQVRPHCGCPG